jgi:type IV fimbrial biogenesis protein FimT
MPTRAHTRRDPQKRKKEFSTNKGFTLIETMIVVAVIAIITSLALPSYRTIIEKRQVTNGAEQLGAFLSSVQMEAVKRSENITVSYKQVTTNPPVWCIGLVTGTNPCDCAVTAPGSADCKIDGEVRIVNQDNLSFPGVLSDMDGDGSFVYDPGRGLMVNHADAMELELVSDKGKYALNVQLTATGRVKYCSDSAGKKVPGYNVCGTDIQ